MPTQTAPAADSTTSASVSNAIDALMNEEGQSAVVSEAASEVPPNEGANDGANAEAAAETDLPPAEPAAEESAEPADDQFAQLAEEAISHYGLSQAEVEQAGDMLPWLLARMDRQASALMQGYSEVSQPPAQAEPVAPPAAPAPPAPKAEETHKPLGELGKFELKINREDHDEGTLGAFDALAEEINNGREALNQHREVLQIMAQALQDTHKTASSLKQRTESTADAEFASSMDEFFAKLPPEYSEIYGKQPMTSLREDNPLAIARMALVAEMKTLEKFDAKGGRPARTTQQQAARTLRAMHADKEHKVARREADAHVQKQRARAIASPSARGAKKDDLDSRRGRAMTAIEKILPRLTG